MPGLWRGAVPGLRLLKTFLPYNVVSLSPDTALCALSHNSSVVCLSYIALCFWHRQSAGGPPPPQRLHPGGVTYGPGTASAAVSVGRSLRRLTLGRVPLIRYLARRRPPPILAIRDHAVR